MQSDVIEVASADGMSSAAASSLIVSAPVHVHMPRMQVAEMCEGGFRQAVQRVMGQQQGAQQASALEQQCRRAHVPYFAQAQLEIQRPYVARGNQQSGKRGGTDDDAAALSSQQADRYWLRMPNVRSGSGKLSFRWEL